MKTRLTDLLKIEQFNIKKTTKRTTNSKEKEQNDLKRRIKDNSDGKNPGKNWLKINVITVLFKTVSHVG